VGLGLDGLVQGEKLGLGSWLGGCRIRWAGMRFRFGGWYASLRFCWQEAKLDLGLGAGM
jgi:hypothetical protein